MPESPKRFAGRPGSEFDESRLTFDRNSKACIPHYSIKNSKLRNLLPFFSPDKTRNSAMRKASVQPGSLEPLNRTIDSVQSHADLAMSGRNSP